MKSPLQATSEISHSDELNARVCVCVNYSPSLLTIKQPLLTIGRLSKRQRMDTPASGELKMSHDPAIR